MAVGAGVDALLGIDRDIAPEAVVAGVDATGGPDGGGCVCTMTTTMTSVTVTAPVVGKPMITRILEAMVVAKSDETTAACTASTEEVELGVIFALTFTEPALSLTDTSSFVNLALIPRCRQQCSSSTQ